MSSAIIRRFADGDREPLRALFDRAGADSAVEQLWGHRDSEAAVYLDPYMNWEPGSLFVAEVEGRLAGYLTGCLDSTVFPSETARMDRAIRDHKLLRRPEVMRFFARSLVDLAAARLRREDRVPDGFTDPRWPAHLHIAVLPEARGTGVAEGLMRQWIESLDQAGVPGCYLQTSVENTRAVRFFERMGFTRYGPTPAIPGIRANGRRQHLRTMIRSLGTPIDNPHR